VRLDRIASGGISNCRFSGFNALHCSGNTFGVYITACAFNSSSGTNGASGSYGCIMGQSEFHACAVVGFDVGMAHYNGSMIVTGGHIEDNNTAILLGMDPTGASNISHNSMLLANSFERNNIAINIQNASGGKISANSVTGVVDVAGTGHPSRGISANGVINTMVIDGNTLGVAATVAGIDMTSANGSNVVFVGNQTNVSGAGGSGVEWIMPPNLNAADFTYIGNNNPTAAITFAGLPGQAGVHLSSPIEGMQYDIIDCSTSISTSFLAVAASGGTTSVAAAHRRVRYNATSSNWQVIG
jgi:hypothetical protein